MRFFFVSMLITIPFLGISQNLVNNYSFELGADCDGTSENIDSVNNWTGLAGKPRFINIDCPLSRDNRSYIKGMKLPSASEGNVYAGLGLAKKGEYLGGSLAVALKKDKQYIVKVRIRLPLNFCYTPINELGVVLSANPLEKSKNYRHIDMPALVLQNNTQSSIKNQFDWAEISATYKAIGGEKYITIGNFANTNKGLFENRTKKECTYLFLDVVSVEEFKEVNLIAFNENSPLKKDACYLLKDVEFEKGSDILKKSSLKTLESLVSILEKNTTLKLELSSYTDNSLTPNESQNLTTAQAKTLLHKMIELGVSSSQITTTGKGSTNSISLNNNEASRKKNNRIELKIVDL